MDISELNLTGKKTDSNKDTRAISPVIGVILMVAITVVLAGFIGTFVLSSGSSLNDGQSTAQFSVDNNENQIVITHQQGDTVDLDKVSIQLSGETVSVNQDYNSLSSDPAIASVSATDTTMSAGDKIQITLSDSNYATDVTLIEQSDESSTIILSDTDKTACSGTTKADIVVGKSGCHDYDTINAGLSATSENDVVYTKAGTYKEEVRIGTPGVHLTTDTATLDGSNNAAGTNLVTLDNVDRGALSGFTLVNSQDDGVNVFESTNTRVQDLTIQDSTDEGLQITRGNSNTIKNVQVQNSNGDGVKLSTNTDNVQITGLSIDGSAGNGLQINSNSDNLRASQVTVKNTGSNGLFINAPSATLSEITIRQAGDRGAFLGGNIGTVNFKQLHISQSTDEGVYASTSANVSDVSIENSAFNGNGVAINNNAAGTLTATSNWWGAPDGPSGAGSGSGDSVSSGVTYSPFLSSDPSA